MKFNFLLHVLLLTTTTISGCLPANPMSTPALTGTSQPATTFFSPTATPFLVPTNSAMPTTRSTLTPEQTKEIISGFLQEPSDCLIPCFWGMEPGLTTLEEAEHTFLHFGNPLTKTNTRGNKHFYQSTFDLDRGLSISPLLTVQNDIVKNLRIFVAPAEFQTGAPREWSVYSPEKLIAQYGSPSKVEFFVGSAAPTPLHSMVLYFEGVDLIVEYSGAEVISDMETLKVCPLINQVDTIRIWIGKDPEKPPLTGISLEQASTLTIQQFSELMMGEADNACFNLREEVLPQ